MEVPGGIGIVGAIKAGSGIAINGLGDITTDPLTLPTVLSSAAPVDLEPSGVGVVTISGPPPLPPDPTFPPGTVTPFFQAAAPVGWNKLAVADNCTIRLVSGTGGVIGGSQQFTSAMTNYTLSGNADFSTVPFSGTLSQTIIDNATMASHNHFVRARGAPSSDTFMGQGNPGEVSQYDAPLNPTGSNVSHDHTVSGNLLGTNPVSMNSADLTVRYVDFILCQRN